MTAHNLNVILNTMIIKDKEKNMVILIADAFDKSLPEKLSVFGEVTTDIERLAEADVVLIRSKTKATKEYIDKAKNMKLIIRGGVGMDNIDIPYCKEKGIVATNTPKSSAIAVAELAFCLMLSTPNNLCFYDTTMKNGDILLLNISNKEQGEAKDISDYLKRNTIDNSRIQLIWNILAVLFIVFITIFYIIK